MGKKTTTQRKRKTEYVYGTVNAVDGELEVAYDGQLAGFVFSNLVPGSLHQKIVYERYSGKEKVVLSTPCSDEIGRFQTIEILRKNFDFLFAVDTNTGIIGDERTSISVSYFVPKKLSSYSKSIPFLGFCAFEINGVVDGINPETVGWHILFERLRNSVVFQHNTRIGVIVDSELDKILEMNRRNTPYYEGYYLPDGIQLVYASSDTGKELLPNQMISYCDKVAEKCLNCFAQKSVQTNKILNGDRNSRGYRVLNLKRE